MTFSSKAALPFLHVFLDGGVDFLWCYIQRAVGCKCQVTTLWFEFINTASLFAPVYLAGGVGKGGTAPGVISTYWMKRHPPLITDMSIIKAHNPAHISPGLVWAVQCVVASVLSSICGIPWEPQFQVNNPVSVEHTGIPVRAISPVLGELKSIWALALLSNTLNKEPCKAISRRRGVCLVITQTICNKNYRENPSFSKNIFTALLGGFQHCLEGQGENYL